MAAEQVSQQLQKPPLQTRWLKVWTCCVRVYSSAGLQFCIANYQAVIAKYDFNNYSRLSEFQDKFPPKYNKQFQALIDEGRLVTKVALQAAVDMANMSSQSLANGVVVHRDSWRQSSGFPREIQNTI